VLVARDALTLAGFQVDSWGTVVAPDAFHLVTARHFAATGRPPFRRQSHAAWVAPARPQFHVTMRVGIKEMCLQSLPLTCFPYGSRAWRYF
jgi:hypothetical protein